MHQFAKYTLYVYINTLHQAAKSMAGDQSEATSHPIKSELAKLVAQLVVITLGGAAISYVFQSLGEERDALVQQASV